MDGRHSRSARTRAALLDAAIEIICTEGVAAATQRAVAARAGTSLASTTYHFSTADDLLVAAFELTCSRTLADFRRLEQEVVARRMTLLDAAMELVGRAPYGTHVPADGVIQLTLTAIHEPRLRPIADAFVEGFSALFRPLVQPPAAADTLVRALSGLILHEMARGAATPTATMRADMARLFAAFGIPVTDTDPARHEEPE
ncbi:TetR/AcrR family transcriptional regulator [Pseudonocardia sp. WMMC193]|uniref:TetR/AcrR family transcriptional regulator n=1 Tax=Pseudonocardia sp. WMMC193 TaxID=2911965 RepID=UPI001F0235CD|nr:TetR family transcriptional regulator [Pseudonocardia sp. WMMC193]MCF7549933.1 TetR family transcriptional regulator [Pseudonocardia sp. WMMC193]